jgi:hypothetical protein
MQIILKVEQYMEQSQGENTQQVLSLSQLDRKGQQINSAVQQAGFTLSRIRPRGEVRDDQQQIRGNTYVRVTVEPVSDEDAQAAIDESRGVIAQPASAQPVAIAQGAQSSPVIETSAQPVDLSASPAAAAVAASVQQPEPTTAQASAAPVADSNAQTTDATVNATQEPAQGAAASTTDANQPAAAKPQR